MTDGRASAADLCGLSATEAARLIRRRKLSPVDLVEALLARARLLDGRLHAWETLDAAGALAAARAAEGADGRFLLRGVPFGAKDIFDTAGVRTSAGFPRYRDRVPRADADVVARLKGAGALLLGKLVTTQGAFTDPPVTRNPWAHDRTPGGSSSGSGAAVAARLVPFALGSQTAGSTLRPAAYCGVVGFKPTYGRVSKQGAIPLAWSLDHVGVLARSVDDCALFLAAAQDERSAPVPLDPDSLALSNSRAPRLGLLSAALARGSDQVAGHLSARADEFAAAGAQVREARTEHPLDLFLAVHHVIMQTEATAAHAEFLLRDPGDYQPRLRAFLEVGRLLPGASYVKAQRLRSLLRRDLEQALDGVDALLLPTVVGVAPGRETTGDPSLQTPFTLAGLPSISLPSGLSREGLPLALQLVAPRGEDVRLLETARWCEAHLERLPAPPLAEVTAVP